MTQTFLIIQDAVIVIAAFVGSATTARSSFKAIAEQHKLTVEEADKQHRLAVEKADKITRSDAYVSLMSSSKNFLNKLRYFHFILNSKENVKEQMGLKEQYEWLSPEWKTFTEAVTQVEVKGTPEAFGLADKLLGLLGGIYSLPSNDLKKTYELLDKKEAEFQKIEEDFADLARKELGSGTVPFVDNPYIENQPANGRTTNPTTPKSDQASNEN